MNKKEELFYEVSEKFSKEEKDSIFYAINYPIMHWQESESVI
jgi:putative IMPACT (imprinted ancient) family translation regulator